jgi:hypothetical protein
LPTAGEVEAREPDKQRASPVRLLGRLCSTSKQTPAGRPLPGDSSTRSDLRMSKTVGCFKS